MESNVARVMSSEALEIARLKMKTNKLIDANEQLIKRRSSCRKPSSDCKELKVAEKTILAFQRKIGLLSSI